MARAESASALSGKPLEAAFLVDHHAYTFGDILIAAALCGEWRSFIARAHRRWLSGSDPASVPERAADEVRRFRRARRLEAAEDLRSWLADRDLDEEDLVRHARAVAREQGGLPAQPSGPAEPTNCPASAWWPEAVLSGAIERWAAMLQRWLTVSDVSTRPAAASLRPAATGDLAHDLGTLTDAVSSSGVLAVAGADDERIRLLAQAYLGYHAWAASAVDESEIRRLVRHNRIDWTWLSYDAVVFAGASAAWEAALCVREDGEPLADVAARAGAATLRRSARRQDLTPDEGAALMALGPGEVGGPVVVDGGSRLLLLHHATAPSADDEEVRGLARAELIDRAAAQALAGRARPVGKW